MGIVTMKSLLEAGVHFGHQTRRWNPKMGRYIFTSRNGIHIIDLQQTTKFIDTAYKALFDIVADGGNVLFVGTKKQAQEPIQLAAERSGQFYVNQRWLGGTLTNFKTIKRSIKKLHDLYRMEKDGTFDSLPKKEVVQLRKDIARLEKFFNGIKDMRKVPQALFIIDPKKERNAILEARILGIPVFGMIDTNCDPDDLDYIIPANDDALRSISLICGVMSDAVVEATNAKSAKQEVKEETKPEPKKVEAKKAEKKAEPKKAEAKKDEPVIVKVSNAPKKAEAKKAEPKKAEAKKAEPKKAEAKKAEKKAEPKKVEKKAAKKAEAKKVEPKKETPKKETVKKQAKEQVKDSDKELQEKLKSHTVVELREMAKENDLHNYSKLKKAELIELIKTAL